MTDGGSQSPSTSPLPSRNAPYARVPRAPAAAHRLARTSCRTREALRHPVFVVRQPKIRSRVAHVLAVGTASGVSFCARAPEASAFAARVVGAHTDLQCVPLANARRSWVRTPRYGERKHGHMAPGACGPSTRTPSAWRRRTSCCRRRRIRAESDDGCATASVRSHYPPRHRAARRYVVDASNGYPTAVAE